MRVAMLHWAFFPVIGGVESHLALLSPELSRQGHEVHLLTGSVDGETEWEEEEAYGMHILRTPSMDLNRLRGGVLQREAPRVRTTVHSYLDRVRPEVLHVHNMHYFSPHHLEAVADWSQRHGVPLVLTAHNVWEDDLWQEMSRSSHLYHRVIAVSGYVARELASAGYDPRRITVVHHGVDTARFRPQPPSRRQEIARRYPALAGRRVIFHPARTSLTKGSLVAVEAMDHIRRQVPDALLVCAGTGRVVDWHDVQHSELEQIRQRASQLGLGDHVHIQPFSWTEMADLYQLAEVTIYPSINEEPFGLAVLEAMASGSPVVVSRSGGMPEFVEDGQTGFVVPRRDPQALAEAVVRLLLDPGLARRMATQALQAVQERHTAQTMAQRTAQVYQAALADVAAGALSR